MRAEGRSSRAATAAELKACSGGWSVGSMHSVCVRVCRPCLRCAELREMQSESAGRTRAHRLCNEFTPAALVIA